MKDVTELNEKRLEKTVKELIGDVDIKEYKINISGIINNSKPMEALNGLKLLASHKIRCRGIDGRLEGDKIADAILNVYDDGTREVICPMIDGNAQLELTHCGSSMRYNSCIYFKREDNTVIR